MCGCCNFAASLISRSNRSLPDRGGELRVQHLDGDVALVLDVVAEIHRGHTAATELPLDEVAVLQGSLMRSRASWATATRIRSKKLSWSLLVDEPSALAVSAHGTRSNEQ